MDGAKLVAKAVVAAGLVFVWPGPWLASNVHVGSRAEPRPVRAPVALPAPEPAPTVQPTALPESGFAWFEEARARCNAVEARTWVRDNPAPPTVDGTTYEATCLALGGLIDEARSRLVSLPPDGRPGAAAVVFETAHPAADAGDDLAAGPVMELVVEFLPDHYMALYHAGASCYQRGELVKARDYLERFLENYDQDDGWTASAREMLATS